PSGRGQGGSRETRARLRSELAVDFAHSEIADLELARRESVPLTALGDEGYVQALRQSGFAGAEAEAEGAQAAACAGEVEAQMAVADDAGSGDASALKEQERLRI